MVPFSGAVFDNEQLVELEEGGSLVSVDSMTAGRVLRGERWDFHSFTSGTTLSLPPAEGTEERRVVVADKVRLASTAGAALEDLLGGLDVCATIVLFGPRTVQMQLDLAALSEALTAGAAERRLAANAGSQSAGPSGGGPSHRMRRSLTSSAVSSAIEDDAPWRTSPRAMLAALGGTPPADCLPEAWEPPGIPRLHSGKTI